METDASNNRRPAVPPEPVAEHGTTRDGAAGVSVATETRWWRGFCGVVRHMFGWLCIVFGVVLTISPLPLGFALVLVGVALVGERDPRLRWVLLNWWRLVRRCAASPDPLLRNIGRWALRFKRPARRALEHSRP